MTRYVAVLVPSGTQEEWSAHLPDFAGCDAVSASADLAIRRATELAMQRAVQIRADGLSLPRPRNYEQIRADAAWAPKASLDWSRVLVSVVEIRT